MNPKDASVATNGSDQLVEDFFTDPMKRVLSGTTSDVPPQTAVRAMVDDLQRVGGIAGQENMTNMVAGLLKCAASEAAPPNAPSASQGAFEPAVFAIFDALEAVFPLGTIAVVHLSAGFGRTSWLERFYRTMQLGEEVTKVQGEARALRLKEFAWWVLEYEYGPHVHLLLQAHRACRREPYEPFRSMGRVMRQARQECVLANDLWIDAAHVRNAASHNGGWRPDIDRHVVRLRDEHPNGSAWTMEFDVDDLARRLDTLVGLTGAVMSAYQRAAQRDFAPVFAPAFDEWTRTKDDALFEASTALVHQPLECSWNALQTLGWPVAPTA
jgi:hypothetical protein